MTTTQHTSGDWYVERIPRMMDKRPDEKDIWAVYSTRKTRYFDKPQNICFFDWGIPEGKANAHLIASAPDLLAVAKLARDFMENIQFNDYLTEHEQTLLDSALAAIAKAEGVA